MLDNERQEAVSRLMIELSEVMNPETDLRVLADRAYQNAHNKGFHDHGDELRADLRLAEEGLEVISNSAAAHRHLVAAESNYRAYVGNRLMLLAGEISEAHEEVRSSRDLDETYFSADYSGAESSSVKPLGFPSEMADVLIRLLDLCVEFGIDLPTIVAMKMQYNQSRPPMHGGKVM